MKKQFLNLVIVLITTLAFSQNPKFESITFKEEYTISQRDAMSLGANDHRIIYVVDTGVNELQIWDGDSWETLGAGGLLNPLTEDLYTGGYAINSNSDLIFNIDKDNNGSTSAFSVLTNNGVKNLFNIAENGDTSFGVDDSAWVRLHLFGGAGDERSGLFLYNPSSWDTEINDYSLTSLNGNLILTANGGSNGSSTPVLTVNRNTLQTGFGNYEFPRQDGTNGQILTTNGSGQVTWEDGVSGFDGGDVLLDDDSVIEYNAGDNFSYSAGSSMLTWSGDLDVNGALSSIGVDAGNDKVFNVADGTNPNDAVNKSQLDDAIASVGDTALNYVTVTDSIYTLQEADILAYKPHIIETYRADGTTQADTVTITYPKDIVPPTNEMLAVTFTNVSGSAIKVVPDSTVVIDKRTKTQRQYVLPKDYLGSVSLFSVSQDTIWANGADWVVSDYTPPSTPSSNLVLNSTLDDSSNVEVEDSAWTISGGVASFDDSASRWIQFELSQSLNQTPHTLTFDLINNTSTYIQFQLIDGTDAVESVQTYTTFAGDDTFTVNFTPVSAGNIKIRLDVGSTQSGTFDLDNVNVTED